MKLRWANRADTSGYTEETLTRKTFPSYDSLICALPVAPFDPIVDTLLVRDVELYYDSAALNTFIDRIALIHDYYASLSLLDSLQHFTSNLHLEKAALLPYNYLKIQELCRVLDQINSRDFTGQLLRNGFDPSGLMRKYDQTYKHSRSLIYNFIDEMHRTGTIPWDGDGERLAAYFTSRVVSYVRRSYQMDQQQGRIYNDCLDHFFDHGDFPPEEGVEAKMLKKMFPDAGQDTIARFISKMVYDSYRNTALQLMNQNHYAEAFSTMENGQRFIAGNPSLTGIPKDESIQSQAAQGICDSYTGIASTCMRGHKYDMAESYLKKADQYALEHSKYIRSDSGYRAVFSELFFLRNADCDQLLEQKQFAAALDCYHAFEKAYPARDLALLSKELGPKKSLAMAGLGNLSAMRTEDALKRKDADTALFYYEQATALRREAKIQEPVDDRLDSLAPLMAHIKFEQIFKEGAQSLEKRQFTLAVAQFKEAGALADQYRIDRGHEFDSLYRRAMKHLLIVQLSASQKKIWANEFDSAQLTVQKTEAAGFEYGFLDDPDFSSAVEKYKVKMQEQKCRNLQDSIELRMIRADRSGALKNYQNIMRYFQEALNLITSAPACNLDSKLLNDSLAKYKNPADYQRNEQRINAMIAIGDYAAAVNSLKENQVLFNVGQLSQFGLKQVELFEFVAGKSNPYLTETAAGFLCQSGEFQSAFRFLLLLREQGVASKQVRILQQNIGQALAKSDLAANPDENPVSSVLKYPVENDWYTYFREAYMAAMKIQK